MGNILIVFRNTIIQSDYIKQIPCMEMKGYNAHDFSSTLVHGLGMCARLNRVEGEKEWVCRWDKVEGFVQTGNAARCKRCNTFHCPRRRTISRTSLCIKPIRASTSHFSSPHSVTFLGASCSCSLNEPKWRIGKWKEWRWKKKRVSTDISKHHWNGNILLCQIYRKNKEER